MGFVGFRWINDLLVLPEAANNTFGFRHEVWPLEGRPDEETDMKSQRPAPSCYTLPASLFLSLQNEWKNWVAQWALRFLSPSLHSAPLTLVHQTFDIQVTDRTCGVKRKKTLIITPFFCLKKRVICQLRSVALLYSAAWFTTWPRSSCLSRCFLRLLQGPDVVKPALWRVATAATLPHVPCF